MSASKGVATTQRCPPAAAGPGFQDKARRNGCLTLPQSAPLTPVPRPDPRTHAPSSRLTGCPAAIISLYCVLLWPRSLSGSQGQALGDSPQSFSEPTCQVPGIEPISHCLPLLCHPGPSPCCASQAPPPAVPSGCWSSSVHEHTQVPATWGFTSLPVAQPSTGALDSVLPP